MPFPRRASDRIRRVATFSDFTEENDPHGEHDFGSFEVAGRKFFWKIDYYDAAMEFGSEDPPTDPKPLASSRSCSRASIDRLAPSNARGASAAALPRKRLSVRYSALGHINGRHRPYSPLQPRPHLPQVIAQLHRPHGLNLRANRGASPPVSTLGVLVVLHAFAFIALCDLRQRCRCPRPFKGCLLGALTIVLSESTLLSTPVVRRARRDAPAVVDTNI